jgi:sugar-specific transcriptional regulator TrmB
MAAAGADTAAQQIEKVINMLDQLMNSEQIEVRLVISPDEKGHFCPGRDRREIEAALVRGVENNLVVDGEWTIEDPVIVSMETQRRVVVFKPVTPDRPLLQVE